MADIQTSTQGGASESKRQLGAAHGYAVGLPDTQGGMCWLAGYESDPTRYYTPICALIFRTQRRAAAAIVRARKTHPGRERDYRIVPVAEMARHNVVMSRPANGSEIKSQDCSGLAR